VSFNFFQNVHMYLIILTCSTCEIKKKNHPPDFFSENYTINSY